MKTASFFATLIQPTKSRIAGWISMNNLMGEDVALINIKRTLYVSLIAMPVSLVQIIIFTSALA